MALDTSQYYKDPATGTTYTSYDTYLQNTKGTALPTGTDPNTGQTTSSTTTPTSSPTTPPPTPTVNTSQPSPTTVTASTTPGSTTAPGVNYGAGINFTPTPEYQKALDQAKASGPAPQTGAEAAPTVNALTAPITNAATSFANVTQALQNDPGYQKLLADANQAKSVVNQSQTLLSQYQQMTKDSGLPAIDAQLLNTQKIINGTEDDIRNEVQAASGFATNSQVLALASARNKTLIQNYNNLLATKQSLSDQINTMIGLAGQDKQFAVQAANQQLQIDQQLLDYQQKFVANAQQAYKNVIDAVGYVGLFQSVQNDPNSQRLIEQSLGLNPGGLQAIAQTQQNALNLTAIQKAGITTPYVNVNGEIQNAKTGQGYTSPQDFQTKTGMSLQQAESQGLITPLSSNQVNLKDYPASYQEYLLAKQDGYTGSYNDYQTMDANRKAVRSTTNNVTYNQSQDQQLQADISVSGNNLRSVVGPDGFVSPQDWKRAYSDWLSAGHAGTDFVNNFKGYVNPADPQDYGVKL